ncbi:hypothetical protein RDWZM_005983 [Blomia tropicalis]|uniref:Genetic suppressor element-like domain-containing protein n=1 Tax=Blomia tropicalis TaxID=40697 RepID=A0A9Q0M684_BLOTA|nr:hypothetical protein RDWZM_005983 [Blomia tropicalis]
MNVLPNSFLTSPVISTSTASSTTSFVQSNSSTLLKQQNVSNTPLNCVVCDEPFPKELHSTGRIMLAVRPSIGTPAEPFFPILESLTNSSSTRVSCCLICAQSLLNQWNDYEARNIPIKNRIYNLNMKMTLAAKLTPNIANASPRFLFQQAALNLVNNNDNITSLSAQALEGVSRSSSSSRDSSTQEEVLDLSMASSSNNKPSTPCPTGQLSPHDLLRTPSNLNKARPIFSTIQSASSLTNAQVRAAANLDSVASASISSQFYNSSISNLIKVASNPISSRSSTFGLHPSISNENHAMQLSSQSSIKKPIYCSCCDEPCTQLHMILIRPMGNAPCFPSLKSYLKPTQIDHNGRVGVCDSCHGQLMRQWEMYQKSNTNHPVQDRHYTLVTSNKTNSYRFSTQYALDQLVNSKPTISSNVSIKNNHIPISASSSHQTPDAVALQAATMAAKNMFHCSICNVDLMLAAAKVVVGNKPNTTNALISISMMQETDPISSQKSLRLQTAQELDLNQFLTPSGTALPENLQKQLQNLIATGRKLTCYPCFESFASRNNPNDRSHQESINGNLTKSSSHESSSNEVVNYEMCVACQQNKAQILVETKENAKDPFFPFLRDPSEPNDRAKLCGACHLILETQWDAYEAGYVPYHQRTYRLSTNQDRSSSVSTLSNSNAFLLSKRPATNSLSSSNSPVIANLNQPLHSNGQPTPPLKIQISSPSVVAPPTGISSNDNCQLLLTTVTNSNASTSTTFNHNRPVSSSTCANNVITSSPVDDETIFYLINEFMTKLGGPSPNLSGTCAVCNLPSCVGGTYQVHSTPQKFFLSQELGPYPYFPMLKGTGNSTKKLKVDTTHLACIYCYHSLIAQWTAYRLSSNIEDRDPNNRQYNCRNFICYVCGVTTYRQSVQSITVKSFPFLIEHKRPPGALSLKKGEEVITCRNCFETLAQQWQEYERMKVPLEMRRYNWMPVQQAPPPPLKENEKEEVKLTHMESTNTSRSTVVATTGTVSQPSTVNHVTLVNHNGMAPGPTITLVSKTLSGSNAIAGMPYQAIIESSESTNNIISTGSNTIVKSTGISSTQHSTPVVTLNPSHTLAPLVAAAMAATPVSTINKEAVNGSVSIVKTENSTVGNANSFADALRQLARASTLPVKNESSILTIHTLGNNHSNHQPPNSLATTTPNTSASNHSINLSTLASVAALAGNHHKPNHRFHSQLEHHNLGTSSNHAIVGNLANHMSQQSSINEHSKLLLSQHDPKLFKLENSSGNGRLLLNTASNGTNMYIQLSGAIRTKEELNYTNVGKNVNDNHIMTNLHHHHYHNNKTTKPSKRIRVPSADSPQNGERSSKVVLINMEEHENREREPLKRSLTIDLPDKSDIELEIDCIENKKIKLDDENNDEEFEKSEDDENNLALENENNVEFSMIKLLDQVISPLPLSNDPKKLNFFTYGLGLLTKADYNEYKFHQFVRYKMARRLSHMSFKMSMFDEDEILEPVPISQNICNIECSEVMPNSIQLTERLDEKEDFMNSLNLISVATDSEKQLKRELSWLTIIKNRHIRRKRGDPCSAHIQNNLSHNVLHQWIGQLAAKFKMENRDKPSELKIIKLIQPLLSFDYIDSDDIQEIKTDSDNEIKLVEKSSTIVENQKKPTIDKKQSCDYSNNFQANSSSDNQPIKTVDVSNNNESTSVVTQVEAIAHNNQLSTNKLINPKQFAQDFYDSLWKETNEKQATKAAAAAATSMVTHQHLAPISSDISMQIGTHQQAQFSGSNNENNHLTHSNAQKQYLHLIHSNESSSSKPNQITIVDGGFSHSPPPTVVPLKITPLNIFKFPEKIGLMREQIIKVQQRMTLISQKAKYLNEKKNEIDASLQKLEEERNICQAELDRLAKSIESSII